MEMKEETFSRTQKLISEEMKRLKRAFLLLVFVLVLLFFPFGLRHTRGGVQMRTGLIDL